MANYSTPQFLYLITKGWKTEREHRIEIWFVEHEGKFYILSECKERAHWVQNNMLHSAVSFNVGSDSFISIARIIDYHVKESKLAGQIAELMAVKSEWNEGLIAELSPILISESK